MKSTSKKQVSVKKASTKNISRPKKNKLGHDPLDWISDEDAAQLKSETKKSDVTAEKEIAEIEPVTEEAREKDIMSEQTIFELPPYFGIAQVASIKEAMQSFLKNSTDEIEIEAEGVESIDTAALQLLISFVKQAKSKGKSVKWKSVSNKLESSSELLAIKEELSLS